MAAVKQRPWLRRLAMGLVAATGIAALTLPTTPTEARVFVSVGVPGVWGYYAAPRPYYYAYPTYYGYPYPYYYGYPAGAYYGRPFYGHPHPYWHRRWRHHWR